MSDILQIIGLVFVLTTGLYGLILLNRMIQDKILDRKEHSLQISRLESDVERLKAQISLLMERE